MSRRSRRRGSNGQSGRPAGRQNEPGRKERPAPETKVSPVDQSQTESIHHSKANMVVLLDSDPDYVEMESKAVVNYISGYNPMGFTLALKALNYITNPRNEGRIGLLLLDLELRDQEGHTAAEVLDVVVKNGDIPVAAVSLINTADNVRRVLELGGVGFLPKAFTTETFVRFTKDILRKGKSPGWQCNVCGKLVEVNQLDLLKMKPIKCSDRQCDSLDIREISFSGRRGK